jgi:hypothetical protein
MQQREWPRPGNATRELLTLRDSADLGDRDGSHHISALCTLGILIFLRSKLAL